MQDQESSDGISVEHHEANAGTYAEGVEEAYEGADGGADKDAGDGSGSRTCCCWWWCVVLFHASMMLLRTIAKVHYYFVFLSSELHYSLLSFFEQWTSLLSFLSSELIRDLKKL